jgi:hypothetical protein
MSHIEGVKYEGLCKIRFRSNWNVTLKMKAQPILLVYVHQEHDLLDASASVIDKKLEVAGFLRLDEGSCQRVCEAK